LCREPKIERCGAKRKYKGWENIPGQRINSLDTGNMEVERTIPH